MQRKGKKESWRERYVRPRFLEIKERTAREEERKRLEDVQTIGLLKEKGWTEGKTSGGTFRSKPCFPSETRKKKHGRKKGSVQRRWEKKDCPDHSVIYRTANGNQLERGALKDMGAMGGTLHNKTGS